MNALKFNPKTFHNDRNNPESQKNCLEFREMRLYGIFRERSQ